MKIWISTYRNDIEVPEGWVGNDTPSASLQMRLMRLPLDDKRYSLIIDRNSADSCMLAIHHINAQGADLAVDELKEEQARSLALAYLLRREEICEKIAGCIQGQGVDTKADIPALEKVLLQYISEYPVRSTREMTDTILGNPHVCADVEKTEDLLHNFYFSISEGTKLVFSDTMSTFSLQGVDIVLVGTSEDIKRPDGIEKKIVIAVAALLVLVIACVGVNRCGTDSKKKDEPIIEQPVKRENPPAPQPDNEISPAEAQNTAEPIIEQPVTPENPPAPQPDNETSPDETQNTAEPIIEQPVPLENPPAPQPDNETSPAETQNTAEPIMEQPVTPENPPAPQPDSETSPAETQNTAEPNYESV